MKIMISLPTRSFFFPFVYGLMGNRDTVEFFCNDTM